MTVRAMLFDIDGTLVDSNYLHVEAWQHAFAELGAPTDAWRIHRAIGEDSAHLLRSLVGERDEAWNARARALHAAFYDDLAPRLRALPGARDLLRAVTERELRAVLATSAPEEEFALLRRTLDADRWIYAHTSADDVDTAKPDPEVVAVALDRAGAEPAEAVFVGDSTWDMIAAGRAGVRAYGVRSGGVSDSELVAAGAAAVYDDPADLLEHLDEIIR
ncbi:HAD family hydrolase [Agromyces aerolatus]|uniref:HAD family hydrolase n=1 Tax=Agromyces sp. LY-1074 TaxID=3074080 RepID=UPI0028647B78|nr:MULTISPECIES: HAD family hydrolase [unclassified Agromyces]MDR5699170.1 HAD family hydrolase [Agromyces sp. LY-1074]MDR5705465.1 HAD family hydrolase [Agromyces sp. LY-1358]